MSKPGTFMIALQVGMLFALVAIDALPIEWARGACFVAGMTASIGAVVNILTTKS